jgi:hypothetical protein
MLCVGPRNKPRAKGGAYWAAVPANRDLKNAYFVDVISNVLRDLPLSRNQLLKSVYDSCKETLKNKIKKLGICKLVLKIKQILYSFRVDSKPPTF